MYAEKKDEYDSHLFFNYMFNLHLTCLQLEKEISDKCANRVLRDLEISVDKVDHCMKDSFEVYDDWESPNYILEEDRESANHLGIQMNPSVTINGFLYNGDLKAEHIFNQICRSYHVKA